MSNINTHAAAALDELSDAELDQVLGAEGMMYTLSQDCRLHTWQYLFTCCS